MAAEVPVYDVGAHAGFFTLLASRLAGDRGRVYALEACPDNVERLRRNVEANRALNVEVVALAASDRDGEAAFVMHESTLQGRLAGEMEHSAVTVRTTTIDTLVREGMTPPDVIKIDVEGAEGAVVRGAARTIAVHRPALLLEVHAREAGTEVADAMPCRYTFRDLATGIETGAPNRASHYLALPVVGPGRLG